MNTTKLCKDCKHILRYPYDITLSRCTINSTINVVSGELNYKFAENERLRNSEQSCGPSGKFFKLSTAQPQKLFGVGLLVGCIVVV